MVFTGSSRTRDRNRKTSYARAGIFWGTTLPTASHPMPKAHKKLGHPATARKTPPAATLRWGWFNAGVVLLAAAVVLAVLLSLKHLDAIALPGCGGTSDCEKAARSPWATIPGVGVPVAFLALGYQVAALVVWVGHQGRPGVAGRWVVRLGAAGSLLYLGVSAAEGIMCVYCLGVHACNIVLVAMVDWPGRKKKAEGEVVRANWVMPAAAVLAIAAVLPFVIAHGGEKRKAERALEKSTKEMAKQAAASSAPAPVAAVANHSALAPASPAFTGRYRLGPELAMVRVVVFTDYQCPDCKRLEGEMSAMVRADGRLSLSIKHFPLSKVCNPHLQQEIHPDACWAARAAEVAGILGGNEAFWRMSEWLFERNGSFDQATLLSQVTAMGFDATRFVSMLESAEVGRNISSDIAEAMDLGIQGGNTPMIFINGVELKGWNVPGAFARATQAVLAANPPARDASADRPPRAREKYVRDWAESAPVQLSPDLARHTMGEKTAPVRVIVFGDYLEPNTLEADATVRALAAAQPDTFSYTFLHFPFDQACNAGVPMTKHPNACMAARLTEAAGTLQGTGGFWKAHAWLTADRSRTERLLAQGLATNELAQHLGVDAGALHDASVSAIVADIVQRDVRAAQGTGLTSLPWIIVNDRVVRQWRVGSESLLPTIIDEAKAGK